MASLTMFLRSLFVTSIFILFHYPTSCHADCRMEYETCKVSFIRNNPGEGCCADGESDLQCVAGGPTDDTHYCLSERSQKLNSMTHGQQMAIVKEFFHKTAPPRKQKTNAQINSLLRKNRGKFSKMISEYEFYYKIKFDTVDGHWFFPPPPPEEEDENRQPLPPYEDSEDEEEEL